MRIGLVSHSIVSGKLLAAALGMCLLVSASVAQRPQQITVAAAADLQPVLPEIISTYKANGGDDVRVTFGASGSLFAQVSNGAPYDVFLSADTEYPRKLIASGNAVSETFTPFARGALVLYVAVPLKQIENLRGGAKVLLLPEVRHIAIANPTHAPYGRAAVEALKKAGVYDAVAGKLILGENVRQAFEFAQSGNAEVAIVSRSLAQAAKAGTWWELPLDSYAPLDQAAVVTSHGAGNPEARRFVKFLRTPVARAVFERHGFRLPSGTKVEAGK